MILLDKEKIEKGLATPSVTITVLETTTSTNDTVKKLYDSKSEVQACIAESQTKGRGRFQRTWHSPFGQNIYLSLLYSFIGDINQLNGLSLVIGLAVCKAIETCGTLPMPLLVKWPNDIITDNKKLAGSLIEIQLQKNGHYQVVIGIGLNVNMTRDPQQEIPQDWTSLKNITGHDDDRNPLCAALIDHVTDYFNRFKKNGLTSFSLEWQQRDALFTIPLHLKSQQTEFHGIGQGISEKGHLRIKCDDNSLKEFSSGDTTILKSST